MKTTTTRRSLAAAGVGLLALGALGVVGPPPAPAEVRGRDSNGRLEAVRMGALNQYPRGSALHVQSGKTVALSTLGAAKKPTLVWFWAPH